MTSTPRPDVLQEILQRKAVEIAERSSRMPVRELSARAADAPVGGLRRQRQGAPSAGTAAPSTPKCGDHQ